MDGHDSSDQSDASLIEAIRDRGSESAFRVLYDRHTLTAYRAAWRMLGGSTHDAEDATQEAWARAIESFDRWQGRSPFGAWLRGIAINVSIDMLRKTSRMTDEVDVEIEESIGIDDRLDMQDAIAGLPPGYRAVLVLHDLEGLSHEEIGERLGIAAGTSKGQLFKARRAMRARLGTATVRDA
jgi:RNA polymerase sigma-70 factor (ECF subfamily)